MTAGGDQDDGPFSGLEDREGISALGGKEKQTCNKAGRRLGEGERVRFWLRRLRSVVRVVHSLFRLQVPESIGQEEMQSVCVCVCVVGRGSRAMLGWACSGFTPMTV